MTFNGTAPEDLGNIRVTKWTDRVAKPFARQELYGRHALRAGVNAPGRRTVQAEFFASAAGAEALSTLLRALGAWLTGAANAKLTHHHEPFLYYLATCSAIGEPVFAGLSARVKAAFSCSDPRPWSLLTGLPLMDAAAETADFSFGGEHCLREHGVLFEETEHQIAPEVKASVYEISGRSGTLRFTGAGETLLERTRSGKLYFASGAGDEPLPYAAAQAKAHELSAWLLGAGRAPLVFDYEPGKRYLAEVLQGLRLSRQDWENGCVPVTFVEQPWAEDAEATTVTEGISNFTTAWTELRLDGFATAAETPWKLTLANTGATPVTRVYAGFAGQAFLDLGGIALGPGQALTLDAEAMTALQGGANLMPGFEGDFLPLPAGGTGLGVKGAGCDTVTATLEARGRCI